MKNIIKELIDFSAYIIKYGAVFLCILFTIASMIIMLSLKLGYEGPAIVIYATVIIKCIATAIIAFGGFLLVLACGNISIKRIQWNMKEYFKLTDRPL